MINCHDWGFICEMQKIHRGNSTYIYVVATVETQVFPKDNCVNYLKVNVSSKM